jgi:hypothetical protein
MALEGVLSLSGNQQPKPADTAEEVLEITPTSRNDLSWQMQLFHHHNFKEAVINLLSHKMVTTKTVVQSVRRKLHSRRITQGEIFAFLRRYKQHFFRPRHFF